MNNQLRLLLFFLLSFVILLGSDYLMRRAGLIKSQPAPAAKPAQVPQSPKTQDATPPAPPASEATQPSDTRPAAPKLEAAAPDLPDRMDPKLLVLGNVPASASGTNPFRLRVGLDQRGGAVQWIESTVIEAERVRGRTPGQLLFLRPDSNRPSSLTLGFAQPPTDGGPPNPAQADWDTRLWEVERDDQGKVVHELPRLEGKTGAGQEIRFRAPLDEGLTVLRRYRLWPGENTFEMTLEFQSERDDRTFAYRLLGPHNIPIEGDWYTSTFRDVFIGMSRQDAVEIKTLTAYDVAKNETDPYRFTELPVRFVGVENQYFAVFVMTPSEDASEKWIAEARSALVEENRQDRQRSNVTVDLLSKKLIVGPNRRVVHDYKVVAVPKTVEALPPVAADLAVYRKGLWLIGDLSSWVAKWVITPLLVRIYQATTWIARLFGGTKGNWGIAIILLTVTVRLMMFPISRKQAISAKKMQDLQPLMNELREKYKDDKERMTKETFALYGKYKVNPFGGCLPALIQLPIFIGLWQALNNSVDLRHASFLWMANLAAPDMLFRFPFDMQNVPLIGGFIGPYFNLLPLIVAGLMLVHTKLFAPPATTPEAEAQQNMMKYMMIFMVFMFYKVPSGLGIYFITSSLWQLGERLFLPKVLPGSPVLPAGSPADTKKETGPGAAGDSPKSGWLAQKLEKLLEEASKDPTVRNRMQALEEARQKERESTKSSEGSPGEGGRGGKTKNRPTKRR